MAQADMSAAYPGWQRAGVKRMKKHLLKIDMTPMVDLGFLLISFFVITTALSRPKAMNVMVPADGPPMGLAQSDAMTVLLAQNNKVFCYFGDWKQAILNQAVFQTSYAGNNNLRDIIFSKQALLAANPARKEGKDGLMLLIKASGTARYENFVDVLDELTITGVKKYAIVKITSEETAWLRQREEQ